MRRQRLLAFTSIVPLYRGQLGVVLDPQTEEVRLRQHIRQKIIAWLIQAGLLASPEAAAA